MTINFVAAVLIVGGIVSSGWLFVAASEEMLPKLPYPYRTISSSRQVFAMYIWDRSIPDNARYKYLFSILSLSVAGFAAAALFLSYDRLGPAFAIGAVVALIDFYTVFRWAKFSSNSDSAFVERDE